jgi:hypothetical protein
MWRYILVKFDVSYFAFIFLRSNKKNNEIPNVNPRIWSSPLRPQRHFWNLREQCTSSRSQPLNKQHLSRIPQSSFGTRVTDTTNERCIRPSPFTFLRRLHFFPPPRHLLLIRLFRKNPFTRPRTCYLLYLIIFREHLVYYE